MKNKIYAMIPARMGSTRLKMKNLALVNEKPLIYYAIKAAKDADIFDRIIINSDSIKFKEIADRYDVDFYLRPQSLGGSTIKSDDVVLDFIDKHSTDVIAWVNPISPLQTGAEIKDIIKHFIKNNLNTLITVIERQTHCVHNQNPINFNLQGKFEQTQDLIPIQEMVYSIMMWKTESFIESMRTSGQAILHGEICYYPVDKLSSIIVKTSQDLKLVQSLMKIIESSNNEIEYDELASVT